jgi:CheY-like chemotaxis protein
MKEALLPKILIVEDKRRWQDIYAKGLEGIGEPLPAYSLDEARELFSKHTHDIRAIIMDGCLTSGTPDTPPLVREIRAAGFIGPIIAASATHNKMLLESGCDHSAPFGDNESIPQLIKALLERERVAAPRQDYSLS